MAEDSAYAPSLRTDRDGNLLTLYFEGDWVLQNAAPDLEDKLRRALDGCEVSRVVFNGEGIRRWDSRLLVPLLRVRTACSRQDLETDLSGLPRGVRDLVRLADEAPEADQVRQREQPEGILETAGVVTLRLWSDAKDFTDFVGNIFLALWRLLLGKSRMRVKDFLLVIQDTGFHALPIVALISFLVGLIIAFLGAVVLRQFGAGIYISYLVGYGMLREMAAVMTGIIMAGRTGAAFAAQLGSMKASEEIDALRTLGISPMDFLVLPRVLGLFLMMPLLVVFSNVIGIFGGLLVALSMLDLSMTQYFSLMNDAANEVDLILGIVKGIVFGALIAMAGCLRGLQSGTNADAVGRATTSAVVTAITFIIFFNTVIDWVAATFNI